MRHALMAPHRSSAKPHRPVVRCAPVGDREARRAVLALAMCFGLASNVAGSPSAAHPRIVTQTAEVVFSVTASDTGRWVSA